MLGRLLKKILPKRREKPLTQREILGRNHVGYPTMQISREIDDIVSRHYKPARHLIKFYKETLFFKWWPAIINTHLTDEQMAHLSGRNVQMVYLLLLRDMLRHIEPFYTPRNSPPHWGELLIQEVIENCKILEDKDDNDVAIKRELFEQTEVYSIEHEQTGDWIHPIVDLIGVPAKDFYYWHRSLTQTILQKVDKSKKDKKKDKK